MPRTPNNTKGQDFIVLATDEIHGEDANTVNEAGGPVVVVGGVGDGTGAGGDLSFTGGVGGATGPGGTLSLVSGAGGSTSGASGNVIIGPGAVTSGTVGEIQINGLKTRANRIQHDLGTSLILGNFTFSGGWGSTAALSGLAGNDSRFLFTMTPGGVGFALNPTITLTYTDGAWPNAPFPMIQDNGSIDGGGGVLRPVMDLTTRTTTQATWTFLGTPAGGDVFKFIVHVLG